MKKIISVLMLAFLLAYASPVLAMSADWSKAIDARTTLIWVDAQILGKMVLNARAKLFITWLPKSLLSMLRKDHDADEWITNGLGFYSSINEDTAAKVKGRDIIALNYATLKSWHFNPSDLVIGDYHVTDDDILGHEYFRGQTGDLPSGIEGLLFICVPSLKPGRSVTITLENDSAVLELPKK